MHFVETRIPGSFIVEPEPLRDERGFFARTCCVQEFGARGLNGCAVQSSVSFNARKGTLRGMHYQVFPHAEAKLVRCTSGAVYDVILDLRRDSGAFGVWVAVELTAENHRQLYIPEGLAHGFQTLADASELFYQMTEFYHPECARGIRWDDPIFGIQWPLSDAIISERDRTLPDWPRES